MSHSPEEVLQQLLSTIHTIQISSITPDGLPNISYAPYVRGEDGVYYIFISQLASHTEDLLANPTVAILLTEDENNTRQVFARTRVIYHCRVEAVHSEGLIYEPLLSQFSEKFGNVFGVLRELPDFILFRLIPESGRFIKGFGQAYELKGKKLQDLKHIKSSS